MKAIVLNRSRSTS